jgi:alpha-L-fucosidase
MKVSTPQFLSVASLAAVTLTTLPASAQTITTNIDPRAGETKAQRDERMKWWREARFGMFIHWGLYSIPAGVWKGVEYDHPINGLGGIGEQIMRDAHIPVAEYAKLAPQFNPTQFDAKEWVGLAKAAGMKYLVITAKHHDGFAMYPSKVSKYNIIDATPFKRDPIAELAEECRKQGIKFGIYYSQGQDWTHPGGGIWNGPWDPAQKGDIHEHVRTIAAPQVRELMEKYKPATFWWDTPVDMSPEDLRLLTDPFKLNPGVIDNDRLGNGVPGDTETPEQRIPATGIKDRDWETCMTMNTTWGYQSFNHDYKSSSMLIRNLIDIASKGGNYLLNIGPDARGVVPQPQVERLQDIAKWMKVNSASIYATTPSPFPRLPFNGRATVKGNNLYLNVFEWPAGGLTLANLTTPVREARALASNEKLEVLKGSDGLLRVAKPKKIDAVSTVITLKLAGAPSVVIPETIITPAADGNFTLKAADATIEGESLSLEGPDNNQNLGYWTNEKDAPVWKINVPTEGKYQVQLEYAVEAGSEGSTVAVQVDGVPSGVTGTTAGTGSWGNYRTATLDGMLELTPGKHAVKILVTRKTGFGVMNLRRVELKQIAQ